jgi:coenzyme F420-0:L-glutamate ligase / coenzyme F420-1:gamma-L-glutamate ligase
LTTS